MPYKFKGKRDCEQSDGTKGKYLTVKKNGNRRCYKSKKQYKAAMAWARESDEVSGEILETRRNNVVKISIKNLRRLIRESMSYEEKITYLFNIEDDRATLLQAWELANLAVPELVASGAFLEGPIYNLNNEERVLREITWDILEEIEGFPKLQPPQDKRGYFRMGEFAIYGREWKHHNPTKSYVDDKWDANDEEESRLWHEIMDYLWNTAIERYEDSYFDVEIIQEPTGIYGKDYMADRGGKAILTSGSGHKYRFHCHWDEDFQGVWGGFILQLTGKPR